jgi:hypothetical protein
MIVLVPAHRQPGLGYRSLREPVAALFQLLGRSRLLRVLWVAALWIKISIFGLTLVKVLFRRQMLRVMRKLQRILE